MQSMCVPVGAFCIHGIGNRWHNSSVFLTHEACDFQVLVTFGVLGKDSSGTTYQALEPSRAISRVSFTIGTHPSRTV